MTARLLAFPAILAGCATSMTQLTMPHALEPGDWQVTGFDGRY